jgi:tRNA dimethylallyltransferase
MDFEELVQNARKTIKKFQKNNPKGIIIIRGATATGKTKLSVELSKFFDIEIISCDSRQFFRKMDIGTDKISTEIRDIVPHHLIDSIDPDEHFTA